MHPLATLAQALDSVASSPDNWRCGRVREGAKESVRSGPDRGRSCRGRHGCVTDPDTAARRARIDIDAGRLWKARDRLSAAVRDSPTDQEILELLGEVYFRMGDGPAAWRYWVLTSRQGADAEAAELAFHERFERAGLADRLSQIPAREPIEGYPRGARERLLALRERARGEGIAWPKGGTGRREDEEYPQEDDDLSGGCLGATVLGTLLVGPWLLGLVAAVYLLVRFLVGIF